MMMFSTGLVTGWWLHHNLKSHTHKREGAVNLQDWLPQPNTSALNDTAVFRFDTSEFEQLLANLRFDDALVIYQELERNTPEHLPELRAALFATIRQWQEHNQYSYVISALERFTQHYFDDQPFLDELGSAYIHEQELIKAIETFLAARAYLVDQDARDSLTKKIHKLSKELFVTHIQSQTLEDIIPLFHKLAMQEQEFAFYRYALAECYLAIGDSVTAIRELELLQTDAEFGRKASQILASLMPVPEEEPEEIPTGSVPLTTYGHHYIASAGLQDKSFVRLMIDTGASLTTLPDSTLKALKRKKMAYRVGHKQLKTAGGFVFAPVYQLKELHLGDFILKDIEVAGLEAGIQSSDGLLGMNALGQFHFQIDQDRRQLLLHPR